MGVLVLNPHDVLKNPITSRQALISPPAARPRFPRNQIPSRSTRTQQPNQRKRSPNTSPPARADTTIGDVRILKRDEQLAVTTQQPKEEALSKPDLGSSARFGPDPISIRIPVAKPKKVNGFYAGSAFFTSPPPSSLPLPAFFMMKKSDVVAAADETDAVASSELRKLLGLQLQ